VNAGESSREGSSPDGSDDVDARVRPIWAWDGSGQRGEDVDPESRESREVTGEVALYGGGLAAESQG
jgi:hypothetical protein